MKRIIAKMFSTFFMDGKDYNDYEIGTVKYNKGEYSINPTPTDDAFTDNDKREILESALTDKIFINTEDGTPREVTSEDDEFLLIHAAVRTNMYGGFVIVTDDEKEDEVDDDETENEEEPEGEETPEPDDELKQEDEEEPTPPPAKQIATKKKKLMK